MRVGVEGGLAVARIAGPPADGDLLGIHRVAHDEVVRGRVRRPAGEQADGEVERAPPGVDRRRAAAVGRAERGEHERGPGRGGEVGRDLRRCRSARAPRPRRAARVHGTSCGVGSISTVARELADRRRARSRVTAAHRAVGRRAGCRARCPSLCSTSASWCCRSSATTIAPGAVRRRQRRRLPAARRQTQRGVLELRARRREHRRELAEHLGVARAACRTSRSIARSRASTSGGWTCEQPIGRPQALTSLAAESQDNPMHAPRSCGSRRSRRAPR